MDALSLVNVNTNPYAKITDYIVWAVNRGHKDDWSASIGVRITQALYNILQEEYLAGRDRWGYND